MPAWPCAGSAFANPESSMGQGFGTSALMPGGHCAGDRVGR
jgi:hypothetical protein